MTRNSDWQRVSKRRPCPVCGKADWCMYTGDDDAPAAAICARIESSRRAGEAGWLHRLRDDDGWQPTRRRTVRVPVATEASGEKPILDFTGYARYCALAVHPQALCWLADELGLTAESLRRLQVGWSRRHNAWTFPMRDAAGNVTGIRLRVADGRKLAVKGGKEGLFIPDGLLAGTLPEGAPLLIAEGATDAAALWGLGYFVVGRPSCTGGVKHLVALVKRLNSSDVVIVADADEPGQRGADRLASVLLAYVPAVRVVTLAAKDARAWVQFVQAGVPEQAAETAEVLNRIIDAAPVRRLSISTSSARRRA